MCLPKSTPLLLEIITLVERMAFTSGQQNQGSQKISCHTTANKSYNFFFQKLPKNPHSSLLFDGFFLYSGRLFLITRANEAGCQEKNRDKSLNMCKCLANGKVVCFCQLMHSFVDCLVQLRNLEKLVKVFSTSKSTVIPTNFQRNKFCLLATHRP